MKVTADLHIHSRFSRATSKELNPASLDRWAGIKGIDLIGSGDCTHPVWLAELKEQLEEAEEGFFTLKKEFRSNTSAGNTAPRFVLTGEISTIYKKGDKTRKVHHVVILPDFKAAAVFQAKLERRGNIRYDGRPILGIDSHTLLSLLLEADERSLLIPAHIWTPWFSVLGAKSGFDAIDECYGDLTDFIPAIETGLSSNPPMNWALSSLDRFSIISNSDAHSLDKLGREATIIQMDMSFSSLAKALRPHDPAAKILCTIEFFPQEGKYHYDGHRKCGVVITPVEMQRLMGIHGAECPVCGRPLTMGVMRRVMELADRRPVDEWGLCPPAKPAAPPAKLAPPAGRRPNQRPYLSLIPLRELAGELLETGPASKKVDAAYHALVQQAGSELALLIDMDLKDAAKLRAPGIPGERLAEALSRMRAGKVQIQPGYDGEYGVITVFAGEPKNSAATLFGDEAWEDPPPSSGRAPHPVVPENHQPPVAPVPKEPPPVGPALQSGVFTPDPLQQKAIEYGGDCALIIAGPGTGKTATLSARIARLIAGGADPASMLALSFTVKAAQELGERIRRSAACEAGAACEASAVTTATFHSLCAAILRAAPDAIPGAEYGPADFRIISDTERDEILRELCAGVVGRRARSLGDYIESRKRFLLVPGQTAFDPGEGQEDLACIAESLGLPETDPEKEELYRVYQARLKSGGLQSGRLSGGQTEQGVQPMLDFDDLVSETVRLLAFSPETRRRYQEQYRSIFVDEYQDINFAQYALIRLLTGGEPPGGHGGRPQTARQKLWVIGDPNQAIYGFRGADKRFIDRFTVDYPDAAIFRLERSFRCAAPIVSAAGTLVDAPLRGTDAAVSLFRSEAPSEKSEAEGIARRIAALTGGTSFFAYDSGVVSSGASDGAAGSDSTTGGQAGDRDLNSIAILLRAANLAGPIVKALGDHGIPCITTDEKPWWEKEPCASLLAFLREDLSWERQEGKTGLSGLPPAEAVKRAWELCGRQGGSKTATARTSSPPPLVEQLISTAAFYNDLGIFLDTLAAGRGEDETDPGAQGVRIMTIHASKGLEFDHVFVPALEEGILPFTIFGKTTAETLAEEQRLLYVAMTRAKTGLYLSWARKRLYLGRVLENPPSSFLNKLEALIPLAEAREYRRGKTRDAQMELF